MPLTTPSHYIHNRQPVSGGTVKYWRKDRFGFTPVDGSPYPDTAAADYTATTVADGSWPQGTLAAGDYYVSLEASGLVRSWTGDLIAPAASATSGSCWPDGSVDDSGDIAYPAVPGVYFCAAPTTGLVRDGFGSNTFAVIWVVNGKDVLSFSDSEDLRLVLNAFSAADRRLFRIHAGIGYDGVDQRIDLLAENADVLIGPSFADDHTKNIYLNVTPGSGGKGYAFWPASFTARTVTPNGLVSGEAQVAGYVRSGVDGTTNFVLWFFCAGRWRGTRLFLDPYAYPEGGIAGTLALDDLTDVATAGQADGDTIVRASGIYVPTNFKLRSLKDVPASAPSNGQVPTWDTSLTPVGFSWQTPPGGGSGAPTTAEYVATASDGTLSAEVVIPGLAGSADIAGAAGGGISEEYDTSTTGLTWTPSTPATVDSDTTAKSHLYANTTDTTERLGLRSWSPGSGAFDARCHFTAGGTTYNGSGLIVTDAGSNNRLMVVAASDIGNRKTIVQAFTYTGGAYTQRGTDWTNADARYLGISRDGSNNVSFWWSKDGLAWNLIVTQAFTLTVANIGYRAALAGAGNGQMYSDWLRTDV